MFSSSQHQALLADWQKQFNQALEQFLNQSKEPARLYGPIQYFMHLGGKRLRPLLCMASGHFCSQKAKEALPAALAIELFHNFSLVHDDIMDQAPLRRGQETVHIKFGLASGILSGDRMLVQAWQALEKAPNHAIPMLLHRFNTTAAEVCEGQQLDMDFEQRKSVSTPEYEHMIRLKTAVLLGFSLEAGALSGGAASQTAQALYRFGVDIGIAFQIKDDWLDAFGAIQEVGKQTGGDILARKKTWLWIKALECDQKAMLALDELADQERVQATLALFRKHALDQKALELAGHWKEKAMEALDEARLSKEGNDFFNAFADFLVDRNY